MKMTDRLAFIRHLNVLNMILIMAVGFVSIYILHPMLGETGAVNLPQPKEMPTDTPGLSEGMKPVTGDYGLIVEQNLFHPDRLIPGEKKVAAVLPKPELVLYGTLITDRLRIAYLEDKKSPQKSPGRGAKQTAVKEGEAVSGYLVKKITENMIVLANGEEQMTLYLDELKERKGEITGKTPPPAVAGAPQTPPQMPPRPSMTPPAPPMPAFPPRGQVSPAPVIAPGSSQPVSPQSVPPLPMAPRPLMNRP